MARTGRKCAGLPINPEYEQLALLRQIQSLPQVPPSLKARLLGDLLGFNQYREQGAFRFSETPAAAMLQRLLAQRQNRTVTDSAQNAGAFENYIGGGLK